MLRLCLFLVVAAVQCRAQDDFLNGTFPAGFQWGAATSAYQIEGAWNLNGKGESIWDFMSHKVPSAIVNGDTGDVACDSYNRYNDDIAAIKETGLDFYRFSLAWTRILPTGRIDLINQDGVNYYNRLIDGLLAEGIKPLVTIFHWDLPQVFQEQFGGFVGEEIVELYADYARLVYSLYGDRVKDWITFNEPWVICYMGYGSGEYAPQVQLSGVADYMCGHNLLKAHARAFHIYDDDFRPSQNGRVGITLNSDWNEPQSDSPSDMEAAERGQQFSLGWFASPIFGSQGDYPKVMKDYVKQHSTDEGLSTSRLPEFDAAWVEYIKGSAEFLGLNHYSTALCTYRESSGLVPDYYNDMNVLKYPDPNWPGSAAPWLKIVPWGLRKLLNWINNEYNHVEVIITENGYPDYGGIVDPERVQYFTGYINEMMKAVNLDGCNVSAYTAWSIIDNFEWSFGYSQKYGLYSVDFNDPARPRTPKDSARLYAQIVRDNGFPEGVKSVK